MFPAKILPLRTPVTAESLRNLLAHTTDPHVRKEYWESFFESAGEIPEDCGEIAMREIRRAAEELLPSEYELFEQLETKGWLDLCFAKSLDAAGLRYIEKQLSVSRTRNARCLQRAAAIALYFPVAKWDGEFFIQYCIDSKYAWLHLEVAYELSTELAKKFPMEIHSWKFYLEKFREKFLEANPQNTLKALEIQRLLAAP